MSKRKGKSESIEVLAGGSGGKRPKTQIQDPFIDKYSEVCVELYGMTLKEVCDKLFIPDKPFKYEIKSYKSEFSGVSKTVCGETMFLEESKINLVITYQKDKKEEIIALLGDCFPSCIYSFK